MRAQSIQFDVATVKVNQGDRSRSPSHYPAFRDGSLTAENVSLKTLLAVAYGIGPVRILGPGWLDTDRFDVVAKVAEGSAGGQLKPALQDLLQERFHVVTHLDVQGMPAYDLTISKGGLKMKPTDPEHPPVMPPNRGGAVLIGAGTMAQIADALAPIVGRPVVDKTETTGRFTYALTYGPLVAEVRDGDSSNDSADIFTAVQQQLGLRLVSGRERVEVLVVDAAEGVPVSN